VGRVCQTFLVWHLWAGFAKHSLFGILVKSCPFQFEEAGPFLKCFCSDPFQIAKANDSSDIGGHVRGLFQIDSPVSMEWRW
jgi:hypothetical protein